MNKKMSYVNFNRQKDLAFVTSANADPNTIYFTSDTHEIVVQGKTYGPDMSGKVDVADFEEVSQSLSESVENLSEEIFKRDFSTFSIDAQANSGDGVTYFTPDTHEIIKDGVNYGGSITAEEVQDTPDGDITLRAVTYIQDRTTSTDTAFTLMPNYKYLFGEKASLSLTLGAITDPTIVNHYMFEFTSGSTATTLSLPASIKWTTEPSIKPNKVYQISIENNLGVIQEWT